MISTRPKSRLKYTEKEIHRLRDDVNEWQEDHQSLTDDCWVWEDLVAKATHAFTRVVELEEEFQGLVLNQGMHDAELDSAIQQLIRDWYETAQKILPQIERLEKAHLSFEGSIEFRRNLAEARDILTPDHEFFSGDRFVELRDESIAQHRAGLTEPFHVDGLVP